ncbi:MAG: fructosamine kinase family protein [Acidimicrobiales bacterium]
MDVHPLCAPDVAGAIARAATEHLGRSWTSGGFTDLNALASHPSGIHHGPALSVFAKLATDPRGAERFGAELAGLDLLHRQAGVPTPTPIGPGLVAVDGGVLLLLVALAARSPEARTADDWRSIGATLARLHMVGGENFGLGAFDGFYGPLPQDNAPVRSDRWIDFFVERRLLPVLRSAVDAGHLPEELAGGVDDVVRRLPSWCDLDTRPVLLHGDAQQHNFVSTDAGAVVIDPAPYFGHAEMDLAQVDVFDPVPTDVHDAYREIVPVAADAAGRTELWRLYCYLAAVTVDATTPFGRRMVGALAAAVRRYR